MAGGGTRVQSPLVGQPGGGTRVCGHPGVWLGRHRVCVTPRGPCRQQRARAQARQSELQKALSEDKLSFIHVVLKNAFEENWTKLMATLAARKLTLFINGAGVNCIIL